MGDVFFNWGDVCLGEKCFYVKMNDFHVFKICGFLDLKVFWAHIWIP